MNDAAQKKKKKKKDSGEEVWIDSSGFGQD